jgi:AcrR family transcriptional regulator
MPLPAPVTTMTLPDTFIASPESQIYDTQCHIMQPNRKRGRPVEIDRHAVSLVALRLFERDGFDGVTMDDVAKAAKVSRRTLFRAFPSKAALVWEGLPVFSQVEAVAKELAVAKASLKQVLHTLVLPTLEMLDDPEAAKVARRRLKLIAASPGLFGYPPVEDLQKLVAVAISNAPNVQRMPPSLVAEAFVAATMASILWWARHDGAVSAGRSLREALTALAEAV